MTYQFSISTLRKTTTATMAFVAMIGGFFLFAISAHAASLSALTVSMSGDGNLVMQPGERKTVTVEFQNTGTSTWRNDGSGYVSIYTHDPKYRRSDFDPGTWEWGDHPARIAPASVAPGEKGAVTFELHAPSAEGSYSETFWLASEDTAWIDGGKFTFTIDVSREVPTSTSQAETTTPDAGGGYDADLVLTSANSVVAPAGRSVLLTAVFKNTGTTTWTRYGMVTPDVSIASTSAFLHPSWQGSRLAYVNGQSVAPGQTAAIDFAFTAPSTNGSHVAQFQFSANDVAIDDAFVEIPVDVTGGSGEIVNAPLNKDIDQTVMDNQVAYVEEPLMRIAFLIVDEETDNEVVITSVYSDFDVRDTNRTLLATRTKNQTVRAYYLNGMYYYDAGEGLKTSSLPLRFEPKDDHAVMRVANFDRRLTRNAKYADNEFRGSFELRYNSYKDRTWLINELNLEYYLRGLAETSNVSPLEYQKALITAARTYAYYHYTRASKYKSEFFHITSYSWDQVYNGYGQEVRAPKITQAAQETRGALVTYDGTPVITPYFSRSDGRTRDFNEVWNGSYPWLVSVSVPWDAGRTLWGHGVGLSASGALAMAAEDYMWDEILKHFYTGIDLTKKWE